MKPTSKIRSYFDSDQPESRTDLRTEFTNTVDDFYQAIYEKARKAARIEYLSVQLKDFKYCLKKINEAKKENNVEKYCKYVQAIPPDFKKRYKEFEDLEIKKPKHYQVLQEYLFDPLTTYRQISKKTKIPTTSVYNYYQDLKLNFTWLNI